MCGHDSHITMLLAAADILVKNIHKIPSNATIKLFFQPAEEGENGALKMIEDGCLEGVDEVYGIHNIPKMPLGSVYCPDGPIMSDIVVFQITLEGSGGHGALPHLNADLVLAASNLAMNLATIPSRDINCHNPSVLTIGKLLAGSAPNVMPSEAILQGTLRSFDNETRETALRRIREMVNGISTVWKCSGKLEILI